MARITHNLRNWLDELIEAKNELSGAAFMDIYDTQGKLAHDILWKEAEEAIRQSGEYNIPEFILPLKRAVYMPECISMYLKDDGKRVGCYIDLDRTAGNLSDYASAVRAARSVLTEGNKPIDKTKASYYWMNIIYGQGREGRKIKQRRSKGQRGRTPYRNDGNLYGTTIQTRFEYMDSLAPYWELIDKGNAGGGGLDEGGFPYPNVSPSNFVFTAERKIEAEFTPRVSKKIEDLYTRLERDEYGGREILDNIMDVLENLDYGRYRNLKPGQILRYITIRGRDYKLYLTQRGKLGMRLAG